MPTPLFGARIASLTCGAAVRKLTHSARNVPISAGRSLAPWSTSSVTLESTLSVVEMNAWRSRLNTQPARPSVALCIDNDVRRLTWFTHGEGGPWNARLRVHSSSRRVSGSMYGCQYTQAKPNLPHGYHCHGRVISAVPGKRGAHGCWRTPCARA